MKRVMCIWLPSWPIQRLRAARPELESVCGSSLNVEPALALYAAAPRGLAVVAVCPRAAAHGIAPGMPLAEAQSLGGLVHFEPYDLHADRAALRRLALWCHKFGPYAALEESESPESVLVDISGCGPIFHGEMNLADQACRELRRRGYEAWIAIADTLGAAWALAHHGRAGDVSPLITRESSGDLSGGLRPPLATVVVPPGEHATALRSLSVESLRLSAAAVELLHALDLRHIGQLLDLPRAELPARFGLEVLRRLDQALGLRPEPLEPEKPAESLEASWDFEFPGSERRAIDLVLQHLLERILEKLRPRSLGVQQLTCALRLTDGEVVRFEAGLLHASASAEHLLELLRLQIERGGWGKLAACPTGVASISLRAPQGVPLEFRAGEIFTDDVRRRSEQFPALVERLSNRLGDQAVLRPQLQPDAQPEFAWRYEPWLQRRLRLSAGRHNPHISTMTPSAKPPAARPPCLKSRPVAAAVTSVVPEGPPLRFEWRHESHVVARAWGPERIETGWWRDCDVRRDYYLVETTTGAQFWLFRALGQQTWFIHGND